MTDAQSVARGANPADLAIRDGRVFRPETRTFAERDILGADDTVAAQVEDATDYIDDETTVIDATDRFVVPGFVDAHTHLDLQQTIDAAFPAHLRGGTTTLVTEVAATGAVFDTNAVRELLDVTSDLPLTVRALLPIAPLLDVFEPPRVDTITDYVECLDRPDVLGLGETPWTNLVEGPTGALADLYDDALEQDAIIGSHGAGCRGDNIQWLAHYVTDDHEAITGEGHLERAAAGIHPIGRSGTIRDDSAAVAEALTLGLDPAEMSLSSDGAWPRTLHREGSMDATIRRVIDAGVDPVDALLMATRTPARHFDLTGKGTLAPGSDADVVVLDDLDSVDVASVVTGGELVYNDDTLEVAPRPHDYPRRFLESVQFDLPTDALTVPESMARDGRVNAISFGRGILTGATTVEPTVEDGELHARPEEDVLKAVIVDRHPETDRGHFTGFVEGVGIDAGAVATTLSWESASAIGLGTDDDAIRQALTAVRESQGGWAVVEDDTVVASFETPVAGVCTTRSVAEAATSEKAVRDAVAGIGSTLERPLLAIQTLTFLGVPHRKLTCSGYADILARETVGLTLEPSEE